MNKISRRNFLKVAGAGAAAMGLAACGGSSSSSSSVAASSTAANAAADTLSGTIEYWSSWSETENQALVLKQAADAFTQLHPNVKINFTFNGRDNRNLVVSAIEAGTQIDLMDPDKWSSRSEVFPCYYLYAQRYCSSRRWLYVVAVCLQCKIWPVPLLFHCPWLGVHGELPVAWYRPHVPLNVHRLCIQQCGLLHADVHCSY